MPDKSKKPSKSMPDRSSKFVWEVGDLVIEKAPEKKEKGKAKSEKEGK